MSEATQRLVQGMVDATFSGDHQIKGKADPAEAHIASTPFGEELHVLKRR